jgi:hypothetical protein
MFWSNRREGLQVSLPKNARVVRPILWIRPDAVLVEDLSATRVEIACKANMGSRHGRASVIGAHVAPTGSG